MLWLISNCGCFQNAVTEPHTPACTDSRQEHPPIDYTNEDYRFQIRLGEPWRLLSSEEVAAYDSRALVGVVRPGILPNTISIDPNVRVTTQTYAEDFHRTFQERYPESSPELSPIEFAGEEAYQLSTFADDEYGVSRLVYLLVRNGCGYRFELASGASLEFDMFDPTMTFLHGVNFLPGEVSPVTRQLPRRDVHNAGVVYQHDRYTSLPFGLE